VGMSSAQIGSELGISPRSVRQTLYRLHCLAERTLDRLYREGQRL
jgi:hypothetical protein